jgi:hypothetical protein
LQFSYHCFDRFVIDGYLSLQSRENQVAYFFREVNVLPKLTQEALRQRTEDCYRWVESYARNHLLPQLLKLLAA